MRTGSLIALSCASLTFALSAGAAWQQPLATQPAPPPPGGDIAERRDRIAEITANVIERAHGVEHWRTRSALQADVSMTFGEQKVAGTVTFQINGRKIRLLLNEGTTLLYDGSSAWVSPASSALEPGQALRLLHTFKAFIAAPLIMREPGARQSFYRELSFMGQNTDAFRLALSDGVRAAVGESGWCMAYADQRTHRLEGLADIALPFDLPEDGGGDPYTIGYGETQTVEDVILPKAWTFYAWTEAAGAKGDALGEGSATNVQFVRPASDFFAVPPDARPDVPAGK